MTSNSCARRMTCSTMRDVRRDLLAAVRVQPQRRGAHGTSRARVTESPLANSVTSWPRSISASVRKSTTRSVPPYSLGGTLS